MISYKLISSFLCHSDVQFSLIPSKIQNQIQLSKPHAHDGGDAGKSKGLVLVSPFTKKKKKNNTGEDKTIQDKCGSLT